MTTTTPATATVPWLETDTSKVKKINGFDVVDKKEYGTLGQDAFLKLLVKQLECQDPLKPMEDKEFISQMANFSSLEQMKNMVSGLTSLSSTVNDTLIPAMSMQQAAGLIGLNVKYSNTLADGTVEVKSGMVDSVVVKDKVAYCMVGDKQVSMDSITKVYY